VTADENALDAHLARLFAMHQDRWTAAGRPGVFSDPRMRAFYRDAARRLLAAGRLRFWQLEIDGEIRASQFGFVYGGVLISLQEAYDTTYRAPGVGGLGVVLRGHALRAAIEEGLVGYDFLGGVEDFKTRWGTETHYVRSVEIGHAGRRGHVGWLATAGVRDARRALARRIPESVKARRPRRGEAPAAG
jgi:CelD/BcsL family acetyltransferase involved in cellulose biosynthesis